MEETKHQTYDDGYKYAKLTLTWHGWGSPVGMGLFFVLVSLAIYLLHLSGLF